MPTTDSQPPEKVEMPAERVPPQPLGAIHAVTPDRRRAALQSPGPGQGFEAPAVQSFSLWMEDTCSPCLDGSPRSVRSIGSWHGAGADGDQALEPMEYAALECLEQLPPGLSEKLRDNLAMHEELVRRLCKRNERLRARVRALGRDPYTAIHDGQFEPLGGELRGKATPQASPAKIRSSPTPSSHSQRAAASAAAAAAELRRKQRLRSEMTARAAMMQETRRRIDAEAHEASMRVKLERTLQAARERITVMTRRAEKEEKECRQRAQAAFAERGGLQRSLQAVLGSQQVATVQIGKLEEEVRVANCRAKGWEREKSSYVKQIEQLRNELKAQKTRAVRGQLTEQRVKELQRELQVLDEAVMSARRQH